MCLKSRTSLWMRSISAEWMMRPSKTRELVAGFFLGHCGWSCAGCGSGPSFKDLAEITAIDPAVACRASDEILGLVFWRIAHPSPEDGAAGNHLCSGPKLPRQAGADEVTRRP